MVAMERFTRPRSGSATGMQPHLRMPDDFHELRNVVFANGVLAKRGGTALQGSAIASADVKWLFHAYNDADSLTVRMAKCGTVLYYKVGTGAWTSFKTGLTAGTYPVAVQYQNKVYWVDGVDFGVITIANPPVYSAWTTLASGAMPTFVLLHLNRIYYNHGGSSKSKMNFTNFGDPTTTDSGSAFRLPDDQAGNSPTIGVGLGDRMIYFCQDYVVMVTGAGPFTFNTERMPRGAAVAAWRTVVDMGGYVLAMGPDNVYATDGTRPPTPILEPGKINFDDFDLRTNQHTWAMRAAVDEYWLFYRSKADQSQAAAPLASPARLAAMRTMLVATRLTRTAAVSAPSTTSHCYRINRSTGQITGPHDGPWLSGAWQQFRQSDNQEPWLGSSFAGGKVAAAEQDTFTDVTSSSNTANYLASVRTGAIFPRDIPGASMMYWNVQGITVSFATQKAPNGAMTARVYFDARLDSPAIEKTVRLGKRQPVRGEGGPPGEIEMPEGAAVDLSPDGDDQTVGLWPELELEEMSDNAWAIWGFGLDLIPAGRA